MTTIVPTALTPQEDRTWGMIAHLSCLANLLMPIGGFIAALVVWAVYKDRSRFVERQARESMNFQITLFIGYVISFVLWIVLVGFVLTAALGIVTIVFPILAGIKANEGTEFKYPFILRLIPEPAIPALPAAPLEPPPPPPPPPV